MNGPVIPRKTTRVAFPFICCHFPPFRCGSKLNSWGYAGVRVYLSTYQGSILDPPFFEPPAGAPCWFWVGVGTHSGLTRRAAELGVFHLVLELLRAVPWIQDPGEQKAARLVFVTKKSKALTPTKPIKTTHTHTPKKK